MVVVGGVSVDLAHGQNLEVDTAALQHPRGAAHGGHNEGTGARVDAHGYSLQHTVDALVYPAPCMEPTAQMPPVPEHLDGGFSSGHLELLRRIRA